MPLDERYDKISKVFSMNCPMSSQLSLDDQDFLRLRNVRLTVLRLHKALLDSERVEYEQVHGRVRSNTEFFQLVIGDDWFAWLRPISQLIVQMDDVLNSKEPVTLDQVNTLLDQTSTLLQPAEEGTRLEQNYYLAIQRDPTIAIMHAQMRQLFE